MMRVTDPVCGMDIDTESAAASRERNGLRYWFCSPACANHFDADPVVQAAPGRPATPFRPADRIRDAGIGRTRGVRRWIGGVAAAGTVVAGALLLLASSAVRSGGAVVAIAGALVMVCLAVCVGMGVWQERTGQRAARRAAEFARRRHPDGTTGRGETATKHDSL